ncbi:MAG TPA: hypothetical protein VGJ13_01860, partial [Pseudonocardiaceae bacterium]
FERSGVQLRDVGPSAVFAVQSGHLPLEDDELLLGRDVLDTQIVDVVGHRLSRVSDVLLGRLSDGRLEVAAVDVGFRAVLRRLGLRWLSEQFVERAVDWRDLHLTSARGHDIHLATTAAAVHRLDADDLAELLTRLDLDSAAKVIKTVGPERAAGAVMRTRPEVGSRLLGALAPGDAVRVIDEMSQESDERYRRVLGSGTSGTRRRFARLGGWRLHRPPPAVGQRGNEL